jgi:hypothetical protein
MSNKKIQAKNLTDRLLIIRISYLGDLVHKSQPGDQLLWEVIRGFPLLLQANAGMIP